MTATRKLLKILATGEAHSVETLAEVARLPIAKVTEAIGNMRNIGYIESRPARTTYIITPRGAERAQYTPKTLKPVLKRRIGTTKTRKILTAISEMGAATCEDIQGATSFDMRTIWSLTHRLRERGSIRLLAEGRPLVFEITDLGREEFGVEKEIPQLNANQTVARAMRTQPTSVFNMGAS